MIWWVIIVVAAALAEVGRHYYFIVVRRIDLSANDKTGDYPNHKFSTMERVAVMVGVFVSAGVCGGLVFLSLALTLGLYIFHYTLNIVRGKSVYHLGKNTIDQFLQKIDNKITPKYRLITHTILTAAFTIWMSSV